ncbi:ABC transporter ATP-binding protein [Halorussus salinus]|uniref:ABC transporter ATP-binding protein n=1 Tax=Halorussus salinus TaxID=1364935 RepID=UPI00109229CE|nr:ABC transporter ATP-binding protein [Halorussus salinus]
MAVIQTDGLTKTFGESVVAVDTLDLVVEEGEVYGFLGPNGAGKSTTINLLLDFLHPTDGEAYVFGHDTHEESHRIRERIGILPEDAAPYDRLTGREHLEFAASCKGVEMDVDTVVERVGLDPADAERPVSQYSKGMAQRLGLGMAIVGDPDLLILDEPSSGLDPTGMREMRELIREEAADGTAVFFSSHILAEVEAVCDRVGILNDGRLVAQDTIDNLREEVFSNCVIEATVRTKPDDLTLESVDGVQSVEVDGSTLRVTCENPTVKADVVAYLHDRVGVTDIIAEQASLEEMFETYTDDETAESDGGMAAEVTA